MTYWQVLGRGFPGGKPWRTVEVIIEVEPESDDLSEAGFGDSVLVFGKGPDIDQRFWE